jgi:hypothetical protein
MKPFRVGAYLLSMALVSVGVAMGITNPAPREYEEYATTQLSAYLKTQVCPQAPSILGNVLGDACVSLIEDNQSEIRQLIVNGTERQNLVFVSIYRTQLSPSQILSANWLEGSLPSYEFETVGVFRRFYTYKAERN